MSAVVELIPENHDRAVRLGRHVNHDPRSRNFPAKLAPLRTVQWGHHGRVLNQGQLGSCTGNAITDALNTNPLWRRGSTRHEKQAVQVYSLATQIDPYAGQYPPDDTGSDGLSVCKAAKQLGWLSSYTHAFGLDHTLGALMLSPVIIGIQWHQNMFDPDPATGILDIGGSVAGGHEVCLTGYNPNTGLVTMLNSWGRKWGQGGFAYFRQNDLGTLLANKGDCSVPVI